MQQSGFLYALRTYYSLGTVLVFIIPKDIATHRPSKDMKKKGEKRKKRKKKEKFSLVEQQQ